MTDPSVSANLTDGSVQSFDYTVFYGNEENISIKYSSDLTIYVQMVESINIYGTSAEFK